MHSDRPDEEIAKLKEALEQAQEDLFLSQSDLEFARNENIALKSFVKDLYESCENMQEVDLPLSDLLKNLKANIRKFAKDNNIRL